MSPFPNLNRRAKEAMTDAALDAIEIAVSQNKRLAVVERSQLGHAIAARRAYLKSAEYLADMARTI